MSKVQKHKKLLMIASSIVLATFSLPTIIACGTKQPENPPVIEPTEQPAQLFAKKINTTSFILTLSNVEKYQNQTLKVYAKALKTTEFLFELKASLTITTGQTDFEIIIDGLYPNTDYAIKVMTIETENQQSEDVVLIPSIKTIEETTNSGSGTGSNTTSPSKPNQGNSDSGTGNVNPKPVPEPQPNPNPGTNGGSITNPTPEPSPKPLPKPEPTPTPSPEPLPKPVPVPSPEPDPTPMDESAKLTKLLNDVDSIFKVKFATDSEKEAQKTLVKNFFTRLSSGIPSNNETNAPDFIRNISLKVKNSMIKNSYDMNDNGNFIDVSQLEKFDDESLNHFDFSMKNFNKNKIDEIHAQQSAFFKPMVKRGTQSVQFDSGGPIWDTRTYWSSLQFGIVFKLNGVDKDKFYIEDGIRKKYNLTINQENSFYSDRVLKLNKILFISNQIFISFYKHYNFFLEASNNETKILELSNMKTLLQAFFYGKNAKKIFNQFLKNNDYYDVDNFPKFLKSKNFSNREPGYLDNVVVTGNDEKTFENLLVYLNYLNFYREPSLVKDEYADSPKVNPGAAYRGAFSWNSPNQKADYKNRTFFMDIIKEGDKIKDIDFNKYFYDNDREQAKNS